MTAVQWLGTSYVHPDAIPSERWSQMMLTRQEYESMVQERAERDQQAPKVGEPAPDFVAARLSPSGTRTGNEFQLSTALGRPIALVFGSYT